MDHIDSRSIKSEKQNDKKFLMQQIKQDNTRLKLHILNATNFKFYWFRNKSKVVFVTNYKYSLSNFLETYNSCEFV